MTLGIGLLAIVIQLVWPKITDKIPGSLIAIVVTTSIVYFAKLDHVATIGSVFGTLSSSFPLPSLPSVNFAMVQDLISPAFTIAILAGIESLLSAVVADGMINDRHKSNAELVGQGLGNIFSGLLVVFHLLEQSHVLLPMLKMVDVLQLPESRTVLHLQLF